MHYCYKSLEMYFKKSTKFNVYPATSKTLPKCVPEPGPTSSTHVFINTKNNFIYVEQFFLTHYTNSTREGSIRRIRFLPEGNPPEELRPRHDQRKPRRISSQLFGEVLLGAAQS